MKKRTNQRGSVVGVLLAAASAWVSSAGSSSASAALTVWTDQGAWIAAVQPGWSIDFPTGPLVDIPLNYFASSGIELEAAWGSQSHFSLGSTPASDLFESRGALLCSTPGLILNFDEPVFALAVVAVTGPSFPLTVQYADGTTESAYPEGFAWGWRFVGITSTAPIVAYNQANEWIDALWLSNPVPAPAASTLLVLATPLCGRRRR